MTLSAALMSTTSLPSMSSKLTVPACTRFCALASASSVKAAAGLAVTVGPSFVPLIVIVTVSLAVAALPSVAVTVKVRLMLSPALRKSRSTPATL